VYRVSNFGFFVIAGSQFHSNTEVLGIHVCCILRCDELHLFAACLRKGIVFTLEPIKERTRLTALGVVDYSLEPQLPQIGHALITQLALMCYHATR
jgi:hypothetical protein